MIDLNMTGFGHFEFNKNIINLISKNRSMIFYGESKLVDIIFKNCTYKNNIKFNKFFFPEANSKIKLLFREILAIIYITLIFISLINRKKTIEVYFLSVIPLTHFYVKLINIFFSYKVTIFLHGELEAFKENTNLPSFKYYYSIACKAIRIFNNQFKYIVLGESILKNLNKFIKTENINFIDHPYSFDKIFQPETNNQTINFGIVGKAILGEKNSHLIFKLAEFIRKKAQSNINNPKFTIIGTLSKNLLSYSNNYVDFNEHAKMLSADEFETKILKLDFVLFFYNADSYKYTASGAFFDCVKYEIPFVAIKNDFFNYYQEKFGALGYLEDDYESIEKRILLILNTSEEDKINEIKVFKNNLRTMKTTLKNNTNNFFENIK